MFTSIKKLPISVTLVFLLFCSPHFLKAQSIDYPEYQKEASRFLVSPKEFPVISPALTRFLSDRSSEDSVKVWIFFTDKGIFSQDQYQKAKANFKSSLTSSALKRRLKNKVEIDFLDLPVNQNYVDEVLKLEGKLRQRSRWLNAVSIQIQAGKIERIAQLPFVRKIKKVASFKRRPPKTEPIYGKLYRQKDLAGYGRNYGPSLPQLDQINVPVVHDMGYEGQNVIVGMLDTGYRKDHQAFASAYSESRVLAEWDFINNDGNTQNEGDDPSGQHNHGTYTWSALGGEYDNELYGPAFKASFVLAKTEDISQEVPIEEDNWVAGMEWADSIGAEIISSSLAYSDWYVYSDFDGNTCVTTIAADIAASRGIVVCNAMGNEGPGYGTLIAPADADSILACGVVDGDGDIANFSSRGPTYDGRIKPEVVARGVATYCASASGISEYAQVGGTSLSTPLVGGCVAVLMSAHPDWTVMQTREALMMTANNASSPDTVYGWGLVNLFAALNYNPSGALTIQHNPPLFTSNTSNPYIMSATITPGNGLIDDSLFLFWRSDTLSPFVRQDLQSLGSDQYQAEIPLQSAGTILHYYFSAQDSLNNVVNSPLGAPRFKFKFYVATDFITFDFEDGLFLWETGGINNSWSITSVDSRQGTFSLTDSPPADYQNNTDSWAGIKKTFDLTDVESPQLSFWHRYQFWSGDSGFVEINTDGGKGWERLSSGFIGTQDEWTHVDVSLDPYTEHTNVKFRFHLISDDAGTADGWYIDDVQVNFRPTSVEEEHASVPMRFSLDQNYPNPFNPSTRIQYTVGSRQTKTADSGRPTTDDSFPRTTHGKAVDGSQFTVHGPVHTTHGKAVDGSQFIVHGPAHTTHGKAVDGSQFMVHGPVHTTHGKAVDGSQFMVHGPIHTTLRVYNVLGQLVRTLKDEEMMPGNYQVIWDGKDKNGEEVSSGIYFYQLITENKKVTRKMVLLK